MVDYSEFEALAPFMRLIEESLAGLVDGERYFDLFAEDVLMEFIYAPPGTPPSIRGRQTMIDAWRGYGDIISLDRMSNEKVYRTIDPEVLILEYESHGKGVVTGRPYHQKYLSIVTIKDRHVVYWRDYANPLVVSETIGGPDQMAHAMFSPPESGS
jgi:ketosteroid isomerase-like protein